MRLGRRDPDYITPLVKVLLNKRNSFRRQGNSASADKLASVFDTLIASNIHSRLSKLALAPVNEMWKVLQLKSSGRIFDDRICHLLANPDDVNRHFAGISFDPTYDGNHISSFRPPLVFGTPLQLLYA